MDRLSLPSSLVGGFTVPEAQAGDVPASRLRARDLITPFRGVRLPAEMAEDDLQYLAALTRLLPKPAAFSHHTAARLWGLPLPFRCGAAWPCDVTLPAATHRIRRPSVRCHTADRETTLHSSGLTVTTLGSTWCDLAAALSVLEMVQVGDAIVNRDGWDVLDLGAAVDRHDGRRGRMTMRAALPLIRSGSRSPRETAVRLLFAEWELPEPELNADLYDDAGGWLAEVDFLWRDRRVVAEYYGSTHRDSWKTDLTRAALIGDARYDVVVITDDDLRRADEVRRRLTRLLR